LLTDFFWLIDGKFCRIIAILFLLLLNVLCLQCFDTIGWAAGRASGPLKNGGMMEVGIG